jgi:hypothetical protein
MGINFEAVRLQAPKVLEHSFYDGIIEVCKILFPQCVIVDKKNWSLEIRSRIYLKLNFSRNEDKIYFGSMPLTQELSAINSYRNICLSNSFRVFAHQEAIAYLLFKKQENDLIINIEG